MVLQRQALSKIIPTCLSGFFYIKYTYIGTYSDVLFILYHSIFFEVKIKNRVFTKCKIFNIHLRIVTCHCKKLSMTEKVLHHVQTPNLIEFYHVFKQKFKPQPKKYMYHYYEPKNGFLAICQILNFLKNQMSTDSEAG